MNESIILSGISIADFKSMMSILVEQAVEKRTYQAPHQPKELKLILTRKEVSSLLGSVSNPTLIEWSKTGYLKSFNIGRKVRYTLADVQEFIHNRKRAAA